MTVGDVVCFSMPLLSLETGDPGSWQSSTPEVLSVDSITGIGVAKNPGHAVVKHSLTTYKQAEIEVSVQPISKVHNDSNNHHTTIKCLSLIKQQNHTTINFNH